MRPVPLRVWCALMLLPGAVAAQQGSIVGTVVEADTRAPVRAAAIEIQPASGESILLLSDSVGRFRGPADPGSYVLIVRSIGMQTARVEAVEVTAGATTSLEIVLTPTALILNPITVTASRKPEKLLDAPSAISVVRADKVAERLVATADQHVHTVPGIDAASLGMQRTSVVARGFNDTFSTALLILTDYRFANIPSNRLNAFYMMSPTDLDIDRIEVTLGPGSALYGPNATSGVLHLFTKSPIDAPGSTVTLGGGERSVFQAMFRTAHAPSDRFGVKLSGQFFRGDDWEWTDPVETSLRAADPDNPNIGARDFTASRWSLDARVDYRSGDDSEWVTSAGRNTTLNMIEVNGSGRALAEGWRYDYVQSRFRSGRLFLQAFVNLNDSGDSRFLRTGLPAIDRSRIWAAQAQHGHVFGPVDATYGFDAQTTDTRTAGSITGRFEDDDRVDEVGGYVHAVTRLSDALEAVAALRLDYHNRLADPVWSPRAGLVWRPATDQTLRATYNRAFRTPSVLDLFLDLSGGAVPITDQIFYDIRAVGVPGSGYSFAHCEGGYRDLCMRVPGLPDPMPANATLVWDALIAALAPDLAAYLPAPGSAVGTVLRRLDPEGLATGNPFPLDPDGPQAIAQLRPQIHNTFELGYSGLVRDRLLLTANVYRTRVHDFVGPISVETPNVFLDPATTAAYVSEQLAPLLGAGAIDQATIDAIIAGLAAVPVGTISPAEWDAPDILLTYRNFGKVDLWGFEVGAQLEAAEGISLRGAVSYISEECFDFDDDDRCTSAVDRSLNAPSWKGSLAVRYDDPGRGFAAELRGRMVDGFPHSTGVFVGDIPGYTVVDAAVNYRLPHVTGASIGLTATNLLNNMHREMIGAPEMGRLLLLRLRYDFQP